MGRTLKTFVIFFIAMAQPAFAAIEGEPTPDRKSAVSPTAAETAAATAQRLKQLEQELVDAQRQRDIANIHADLIDRQTSWFEILISVLVSLFGVIVSASVIFFTIRFGNAAVAEAKQAIAGEAIAIAATVAEAKAALAEIHADRDKAHELLADISPSDVPKDKATRQSLRDLAEAAQKKPRTERTADDYRALINVAAIDEDWVAMERRATAMAYLFEDDPETAAFALLAKGFTLGKLGRSDDEIAVYDDVLARFHGNVLPAVQEQVANALFNKGVTLGELGRPEDAIVVYDDVFNRYGDSALPALQERGAKALVNKGFMLSKLGRSKDAIAVYDDVLARFGDSTLPALQEQVANALVNKAAALDRPEDATAVSDDILIRFGDSTLPALQEQVANALFNKACAFARVGRVADCISALTEWRDRTGKLDCDDIANDSDFDPVRTDPLFVSFLAENGCPPPPGPARVRRPRKPRKEQGAA